MKVLNGIACELNWIEIQFNSTIGLKFNWIGKNKNTNWWRKYWKFTHEYDIEIVFFFKKHKLKNMPFIPCYLGTN